MGMYTEIFINTDLKKNTPDSIIEVLKSMCALDCSNPALTEHPARWAYLFNNGSYYTPNTSVASLTFDDIAKQYSLLGKGDIKNYEGEIEKFFAWIRPWCDDEFIGYMRYEEDKEPTLIYADPFGEDMKSLEDQSDVVSFQ